MRGVLLAVGFALAVGATAGLAYLAMQPSSADEPPPSQKEMEREVPEAERARRGERPKIRAYETTATLVEDLRDALAGDASKIDAECWRVSEALGSTARWTLTRLATEEQEASPRVRALLVIAAGVHVQGEGLLLLRMRDVDPRVRHAAVLASGYAPGGVKSKLLGVTVPIGRKPDERMQRALETLATEDKDETVRNAARFVLESAG